MRKIVRLGVSMAGAIVLGILFQRSSAADSPPIWIGRPFGNDVLSGLIAATRSSMSDSELSQRLTAIHSRPLSPKDWDQEFKNDHIVCTSVSLTAYYCSTLYFEDIEAVASILKRKTRVIWLVSILALQTGADRKVVDIKVKRIVDLRPATEDEPGQSNLSSNSFLDRLDSMAAGDSFDKDVIGQALGKRADLPSEVPIERYIKDSLRGRLSRSEFKKLRQDPGQCSFLNTYAVCSLIYYKDLKVGMLFTNIYRSLYFVILTLTVKEDLIIDKIIIHYSAETID